MSMGTQAPPSAPPCPGPDPAVRAPRFAVPAGATDTHAHVIGLPPDYPFVEERSYTPPRAGEQSYLAMLDALGMARGVLVQVSVHGTDNRLLVQTLQRHPQRLRGVAVVAPDVDDKTLATLAAANVRGLRINVLYGGGIGFAHIESLAAIAREQGWHLQFLLDARQLPDLHRRLAQLPVPFVVDHMGHMPASRGVSEPVFQALVDLARHHECWIKLSGAYRITSDHARFSDTHVFARTLLEAAPERMLWGSDWPHVAVSERMPNTGELLDLLAEWVPDEALRQKILVANPARLYGFTG
jgi:2-pyrone-4,6-dicarboxylate lactonase